MNLKKFMIVATVLLLILFATINITKNKNISTNDSTLTFGIAAGYAPFVSINATGEYEGFDIDVANELAAASNKKIIFKDLGSMTSLLMALEQGSIAAIIWAMSITSNRLQNMAMVHYQGDSTTSYPLIFWKKIPENIKSLNDINNLTICVEPNSAQSDVLSKYKNINILPTEKVDDALLNIQYGKADAAFVEPAIAKKFKSKYPEIQTLDVKLKPEEQVQGIGIAIKKENKKTIDEIQNGINILKKNGTIKALEKKWGIA